ncbi:hypothetical protein E0H80_00010 [Acinetobacter sp. ANC 4779]|uniref:hypothetical protein n=1 Tax=Acinetobacter sp. ANC 4779 TaxID=2529848 RepID=UPI00104058E7|nr:hypothetical protein [Acinetobacter sp. ANC 4779]TCB52306.1 hypothetical protein E0H80_00010 [Acinetobacter sp. ANC 4779]
MSVIPIWFAFHSPYSGKILPSSALHLVLLLSQKCINQFNLDVVVRKIAQAITTFYIYEIKEMGWLTLKGLELIEPLFFIY